MTTPTGGAQAAEERVSYTASLAILERALRAEERRGFDDGAVKGGLDRLLARLLAERRLPPGSALTRAVGELEQTSYASLAGAGRAQWIRNLSALLRREQLLIAQSVAAVRRRAGEAGNRATSAPVR